MTTILATTVAPAVPVQIKATSRVGVDRDSVPTFMLEPLPDHAAAGGDPLAVDDGAGATSPLSTQPLAPETLSAMLEIQERTAERARFRPLWEPGAEDHAAEAELASAANLAAAVRGYGRRRAA